MSNSDIAATWQYHNATKHSLRSVQANRHSLDWENQPIPFKMYTSLPPMDLPPLTVADSDTEVRATEGGATDSDTEVRATKGGVAGSDMEVRATEGRASLPALDAIAAIDGEPEAAESGERVPNLGTLARLCFFANGVTKVFRTAYGEHAFRAAACTGALFHIELYLVCGDLPDLGAGVYQYDAHDHSLRQIRAGDFRQIVVEATGDEPSVGKAPVVAVLTSTFWRNAWKYQARAYRHSFWDGGTVLANLLAESVAVEVPAELVLGFADDAVNELLDVDGVREAAIALVALGRTGHAAPRAPTVAALHLPTVPLSAREVRYPAIEAMHAASKLATGTEAAAWRGEPLPHPTPPAAGLLVPLQPLPASTLPSDPIETVIRRRGSSRAFRRDPIAIGALSTALERSTRGIPGDCFDPARPFNDLYLIVNAVDGLESGTYVLRRGESALELLRQGNFRAEAGYLALGQDLGGDAAVNVYFLADLEPTLQRFGNRGYRAAQLEASLTAGKLYLAAYALGLGATGLTFFDDDVTAFFSPHATGKSVMFLLALGRPRRRG